jgi:CubicO group peptidase (beta-lactamase class C family)
MKPTRSKGTPARIKPCPAPARALRLSLLLAIMAHVAPCHSAEVQNTPSMETYVLDYNTPTNAALQAELEAIDARLRGQYSMTTNQTAVGVLDLTHLRLAMVHPDRIDYAASVAKVGILLAYFQLHPDAATHLDPQTRHELGLMAKASSNEMAAKYSRQIGLRQIQEVLNSYHFYDTNHGGGIWVGRHYGGGGERIGDPLSDNSHAATVRQLLRYFLLLKQGKLVSPEASRTMREIFASSDIPHDNIKFVKGLAGRDVQIIRKWGTWENWFHDTAVVTGPGRCYILVAMTHHPKGDEYLADLAPAVDDLMNCDVPRGFAAVSSAMQDYVSRQEAAGVVSLVATRDKVVHLAAAGLADIGAKAPMQTNTICWIASMTKPITATAVMMLQDEGKLSVDDPVVKYLPELGELKAADGKPAQLTLRHLLTHTSGMPEATPAQARTAHSLSDLIPFYAGRPLKFKPGAKWQYCQSGINSLGRIVEVVSGQSFPAFLQARLFDPLGMRDTTFYPSAEQFARLAQTYRRTETNLVEDPLEFNGRSPTDRSRYPAPNGGLFSTAPDYAQFCRMILNQGALEGKRYLKPESVKLMTSVQTGDLKTGFTEGNGWGLGWCIVRQPQGITAMLSPGTFGHGGAFGTQAWIDPVKQVIYVLMFQRSNFPINADATDVRLAFQAAAAGALGSERER